MLYQRCINRVSTLDIGQNLKNTAHQNESIQQNTQSFIKCRIGRYRLLGRDSRPIISISFVWLVEGQTFQVKKGRARGGMPPFQDVTQ
jgi:hypothetical protein